MKNLNRWPAVALVAVVAGGVGLASARADMGWDHDMMMGPGMMRGGDFGFMCNPRHAGMAEWRVDQIAATVKPTEAQKTALEALRTASSKAAETMNAACAATIPDKPLERLAAMEKRIEATLAAIKTVRPAFETFYAGLDEPQKTRLDAIGPRQWGWRRWKWPWSNGDDD